MHSDSLEGVFMQTAGLKVVVPSNPYDAKGLLASAVADPDPVLFLENIKLYRSFRQETPEEHYTIPLGKANVVQEGSDVSIFAYGAMVSVALDAAKQAQQTTGTSVEVIDLRTVWPLDEASVVASVEKTGRAIIVHEAGRAGGVGAEVISIINDNCLYSLLKPVGRVTGYDTPYPVPGLEDYYVPTPKKVLTAIEEIMNP
jgi:pyruvate dehydrogenase E1 component beta subunit